MNKESLINQLVDLTAYNEGEHSQNLQIMKSEIRQKKITDQNLGLLINLANDRNKYIKLIDSFIIKYISDKYEIKTTEIMRLEILPVENGNIGLTLKNKKTHEYYMFELKQIDNYCTFEILKEEIMDI